MLKLWNKLFGKQQKQPSANFLVVRGESKDGTPYTAVVSEHGTHCLAFNLKGGK